MDTMKCVEVYTPDGVLILRVHIKENGAADEIRSMELVPKEANTPAAASPTPEVMSNAQRRFLFRLYALRGVEGEKAEVEIKRELKVGSLKDISKQEASKFIDQLLLEKGGNGRGSSLQ